MERECLREFIPVKTLLDFHFRVINFEVEYQRIFFSFNFVNVVDIILIMFRVTIRGMSKGSPPKTKS